MNFLRNSLILSLLVLAFTAFGQSPVKWSFDQKDAGNGQVDLIFKAAIQDGWYTYSQFLESNDGPIPTSFTFKEGAHFKLLGKAVESGGKLTIFDNIFGMNLTKFKHEAIFTQRVTVTDFSKPITGFLEFLVCNETTCMPPKEVDFSFAVKVPSAASTPAQTPTQLPHNQGVTPKNEPQKTEKGTEKSVDKAAEKSHQSAIIEPAVTENIASVSSEPTPPNDPDFQGFYATKRDIDATKTVNSCSIQATEKPTLWKIFIGGMLGGLLALLTPCVFPMLPMTVAFFTKGGRDRKKGFRQAIIYGLSIIFLYTGLGIALVAAFGPTILNEMASNVWVNLAFFVVFLVFALAFFGLFEITLPASWSTAADKQADRGGFLGIFFMAATLAIVSFSCTGPIVGSLLVATAQGTSSTLFGVIPLEPVVGMFGFSLALALPFALFAAFPAWLQSLPKSGGWMDNVKITLGFLELALAFKFLSTADLVRHWGVLKFELFLAIWIVLAALLALYQFGFLSKWLKGASGKLGFGRILAGGLSAIFAVYMINGLAKYQPMSLLSGIAPPVHYNFFHPEECPHGLDCFKDFDLALAEAKRQNKPLFVDFTGHSCVNCRKMEENVWVKPEIMKHLKENYVVVSLYVDDETPLFPGDKFKYKQDPITGQKIKDAGDKWSQFQLTNFNITAQPLYILMHNDGKTVLTEPVPYTPDVKKYNAFLECGLDAFSKVKSQPVLGAN